MAPVSVFFLVAVHLMFHFVQRFIKGCTGIIAFDVGHDSVIAFNFHDQLDVDTRTFKLERHIDFADCVEITNEFFGFLSNVVAKFLLDTAVAASD